MADARELARRFVEDILNSGDWSKAEEFVSQDVVMRHPAAPGGSVSGLETVKSVLSAYRGAFPDLKLSVEYIVAEGDKAAVRWTATGTHQGDLHGLAPTGKAMRATGISIFRVADGKIVEDTVEEDTMGVMRQLGAIPS